MSVLNSVNACCDHLRCYLKAIDPQDYNKSLDLFSGSSIGQHTRHMIEFFQCLLEQAPTGTINYANRKRNQLIEQSAAVAIQCLDDIEEALPQVDRTQVLLLETDYSMEEDKPLSIHTTLERELFYLIEHTIHHLAIVKIGLRVACPKIQLPEAFGVAPSTLRHQRLVEA